MAAVLFVSVGLIADDSYAAAGFAAGFKAGTAVTCTMCEAGTASAFQIVNSAIIASEMSIGASINDGVFYKPIPMGFPALKTAIDLSSQSLVNTVESSFTAVSNKLTSDIHAAEALRVANRNRIAASPIVSANDEGGCRSLQYGQILEMEPRSSVGWGYQYVTTGKQVASSGEPVGETVAAPTPPTDAEGMAVMMTDTRMRAAQVMNKDFNQLRERAEQAGKVDPVIPDILNPAILHHSSYRTFDVEPDSYGMSDDERADYLIQYLTADAPTHAEAIATSASTPAQIQYAVDGEINNLQFALSMAVLDEQIKLRRPRSATTDVDTFLAEAMGDEVDDTSSRDDFFYRLTHYRQRDPAWIGRTVIDHDYALAQQVQMEAEQLAVKYERWKTKRQSTLLLAQAVAKQIALENNDAQ